MKDKLQKIAVGMAALQQVENQSFSLEIHRITKSEAGYRIAFKGEPVCGNCLNRLPSLRCRRVIGSNLANNGTCDWIGQ